MTGWICCRTTHWRHKRIRHRFIYKSHLVQDDWGGSYGLEQWFRKRNARRKEENGEGIHNNVVRCPAVRERMCFLRSGLLKERRYWKRRLKRGGRYNSKSLPSQCIIKRIRGIRIQWLARMRPLKGQPRNAGILWNKRVARAGEQVDHHGRTHSTHMVVSGFVYSSPWQAHR